MGHAGPVGVTQQLVAHVEAALQGGDLAEGCVRDRGVAARSAPPTGRGGECDADQVERGEPAEALAGEVGVHEARQLAREEKAAF